MEEKQIKPLISVIVPIYNAESSLRKSIDSVLNQTITDYEVILVDDGSTDASSVICDEYESKNKRITVIHQPNGGLSDARNKGVAKARGKWVTFVDSDDWIEPCYIENFVHHLGNRDLVIQGYQYDSDRQGIVRYRDFDTDSPEFVLKHLFETKESLPGVTVDKLYKREIIVNNYLLFNKEIHFAEDAIFFFEYLRYVSRIGVRSTIGYHYVITDKGLTGKRYPTEYYLRILDIFFDKLEALNVSRDFRNKYVWNAMEYWLLYPNMKFGYKEFAFDDMYRQLTSFINQHQLWGAPKISFTSVCLGQALRYNNPKTKYKIIRFIHWYVRRSENRIRSFFNKDYKKI